MYCSKCGAAVVGKFCCCCGKRVFDEFETFSKHYRKTKKDYENSFYQPGRGRKGLQDNHIATACWYACEIKYAPVLYRSHDGGLVPGAYEILENVKNHAIALAERIISADDF
jgi:hypothetical protein